MRRPVETDHKIFRKLQSWQQEQSSLPPIMRLYIDLLRVQAEARASTPACQPVATEAEIKATIRQGIPLLNWNALSLDWNNFQNIYRKIVPVICESTDRTSQKLKTLASDIPLLQEVTRAWYEGSPLSPWADRLDIDEEHLAFAVQCALKPFLIAHAEANIEFIPQEQWRRRYCPVCGGKPDLAFLDSESGARWLLCARCDAEWLFQRIQCPYCDTYDHDALGHFIDESGLYRLYICRRCQSYLKAVDLRHTDSDVFLPLERMLTIDLDRQGKELGYRAGWANTDLSDPQ
jgi:formate dehydrogenase accessory protein FdhE